MADVDQPPGLFAQQDDRPIPARDLRPGDRFRWQGRSYGCQSYRALDHRPVVEVQTEVGRLELPRRAWVGLIYRRGGLIK